MVWLHCNTARHLAITSLPSLPSLNSKKIKYLNLIKNNIYVITG